MSLRWPSLWRACSLNTDNVIYWTWEMEYCRGNYGWRWFHIGWLEGREVSWQRHLSPTSTCISLHPFRNVANNTKMQPIIRLSLRLNAARPFSTSRLQSEKNRIYTTVRTPNELSNLLLLSSSSNVPLLTYWTMSWYSQSNPSVVKKLIEEEGVGEVEGGVGYVEVEMDAPTIDGLDIQYGVRLGILS